MSIDNIRHTLRIMVLICLFCFVIDKIVFFTLNKISDNVYTGHSFGKISYYLKIKEHTKLLIFGSSRAVNNINPKVLDKNSFNMGAPMRNIAYATTLIKTIENKAPQTILIQIDPEYIFSEDYNGEDIEPLGIKYHRNELIRAEIDKLNLINPFQHFFWSISYNSKIADIVKNYLKPKSDYRTYNGYEPLDVDENQKRIFSRILSKKAIVKCEDSLFINVLFYNYLIELKEFAIKNNKKLFFFTAPIYDDSCKKDNLALSKLAKEIKIDYIDFSDVFNKGNSLSYWYDETHLSRIGSEKFSKELNNRLMTSSY
jgi:hypothetical protein